MSNRLVTEGLKYLTEIFQRPYKFHSVVDKMDTWGSMKFLARTDDGKNLEIKFTETSNAKGVVEIDFSIDYSYAATGEGDQFKILSTVLKAIELFLKDYRDKVLVLKFSAQKERVIDQEELRRYQETGEGNPVKGINLSRIRLYHRLVNRFARREGFSVKTTEDKYAVTFNLLNNAKWG